MTSNPDKTGKLHGTYIEVVLHRTVTEEKRIGVTIAPEESAKVEVMKMRQAEDDNGWTRVKTKKPVVVDEIEKGPIAHKERIFRRTSYGMKSTGRPIE